ncbi:MAG: sulfotransferase, partial [Actinobacteria bacterium]|nr:sulfotransferase [Actinomycetota bacterium]
MGATSEPRTGQVAGAEKTPAVGNERGELPNLFVIGAQKCGTTSLHRYLDLHPEISMSHPKELSFFMRYPDPSETELAWYRSHFASSTRVRGEASPNYTCYPQVPGIPERIHRLVPEAKLIYCVRDPIERAVSSYLHSQAMDNEMRPIEEALADPSTWYVSRSLYYDQLERYHPYFSKEQILVVEQRDLLHRRDETMRRIFRFLEVDDRFSSPEFERLWEVSSGKGWRYRLAYQASRLIGGPELWGRVPTRLR